MRWNGIAFLALVLCSFVAHIYGQTCVPQGGGDVITSCEPLNRAILPPQCAPYITFESVLVTNVTNQFVLAFIASQALEATKAIPTPTCAAPLTEMICSLIYNECVEIPITPFFSLALPRTPCRTTCQRVADGCAQLFSLAGQSVQDCDAINPATCTPFFINGNATYPINPLLPPIVIPCREPVGPKMRRTFYCEPYRGPDACKPYLKSKNVFASVLFTQDQAIEIAKQTLPSFAALPSSCQSSAYEYLCRSLFQDCDAFKQDLPTVFFWGRPPCRSACNSYNTQCAQLFGMTAGQPPTDCSSFNEDLNNFINPVSHQTYTYGSVEMKVPCLESSLKKSERPPTFLCQKFDKVPKQCKPYLRDGKDDYERIFLLDAFQQEARANLTTTFVAMLQELPRKCRNFATEMICLTLFQKCQTEKDSDLPTTYYFGRPPCRKICKRVKECHKELKRIGIPPPDCDEKDALTGGYVYPSSKTKLKIPNHDYALKCIDSILDDDGHIKKDHHKRFVRDDGYQPGEDEIIDELDERTVPLTTSDLANTLSMLYGHDHPIASIGVLDDAVDNMIRTASEKVAKQINFH